MEHDHEQPVTEIVEALEDAAKDDVGSIGEILEEFGRTSITTALIIVSLFLVSPLSGIPLFSTLCGVFFAAIAVQGMVGCSHVWLPRSVRRVCLQGPRIEGALRRVRRFARWLDNRTEPRLGWIVSDVAARGIFALITLCGLFLPVLELVPFSSSTIGLAVALMGTGLLVRDGLITLLGMLLIPVALSIPVGAWAYMS